MRSKQYMTITNCRYGAILGGRLEIMVLLMICYAKHLSGWSTTATTMNPQVRFRHIFSALATGGLWISIGAEIKKNLSLMQ